MWEGCGLDDKFGAISTTFGKGALTQGDAGDYGVSGTMQNIIADTYLGL